MPKSIDHLTHLQELIGIEMEDDLAQYQSFMKESSLKERVQKGISWYPLNIKETGYGLGDYPFMIVERTQLTGAPHRLSAGKVVSFFTEQYDDEKEVRGVVHYVDRNEMKIILYDNELPEWYDDGKVGINLLFDMHTYKEMQLAVQKVMEAKDTRLSELREVFLGDKTPETEPLSHPIEIPTLNTSQNEAVNLMLEAKDIAIIHGPPGTGKTTTIVQGVKQLAKTEKNILVCAPSNAATDLLTEKLAEAGLTVVRLGNISRVDESLLQHTLDAQIAGHPESSNIKRIKRQANEYRRMAGKYKRNFGKEERDQRKLLYREARDLSKEVRRMEDQLIDQLIRAANVVTCTLVGSNGRHLQHQKFDTCVIDEAAQALEPATWIPISKSNKVILAGDPFQLPPTVRSDRAQRLGLGKTLMENSLSKTDAVTLLKVQYRMHEAIMGFSNQRFYGNALQADSSVASHALATELNLAIEFIDTAGCGFEEVRNDDTRSLHNPEEFAVLQKHLEELVVSFGGAEQPSIGIISPYKEQVIKMREQLHPLPAYLEGLAVSVNTIDAFQGQERDVIYISMVRSNDQGTIGFLSDYRRMNVAMTRARKKLVIIGDSGTLGGNEFYSQFLEYVEGLEAYRSAWEYGINGD
jgi:ATP-dependent RNA/DNA helicase IGHMBP2